MVFSIPAHPFVERISVNIVKRLVSRFYSKVKKTGSDQRFKENLTAESKQGTALYSSAEGNLGNSKKVDSESSILFQCNEFVVERIAPLDMGFTRFIFDSRSGACPYQGLFLYAQKRKELLFSEDGAETWILLSPLGELLSGAQHLARFYAGSNCFVIQTKAPVETIVLDMDFRVLSREPLNGYQWHGTQGVGESNLGVLMFSEYQSVDECEGGKVCVWRLCPPYTGNWQCVMAKTFGRYPEGEVRHFHTCISDPFYESRWYLSSGDFYEHVKIWLSDDDGENWSQLDLALIPGGLLGESFKAVSSLARYTSASVSKDRLLWPTDDSLGIGCSAIVSVKIDGATALLEVVELLGTNLLRNIVRLPTGYFVISESKDDIRVVDVYMLDECGRVMVKYALPNITGKNSSVTDSMGSTDAKDGRFYFPNTGALSLCKGGLLGSH